MSGRQVRVSAEVLERLADYAERLGDGDAWPTPAEIEDIDCDVSLARLALTTPPTTPDMPEPEQEALSAALEWYAADRELDAAEAEFRMPPAPGELRANGRSLARIGDAQRRKWAAEDSLRAALARLSASAPAAGGEQ